MGIVQPPSAAILTAEGALGWVKFTIDSLALYLRALRVLELLGLVDIEEEGLQQALCVSQLGC